MREVLIVRPWGRPRILRVRLGFNANSSSLAAFVTYFLWGSTAAVLIVNMVSEIGRASWRVIV